MNNGLKFKDMWGAENVSEGNHVIVIVNQKEDPTLPSTITGFLSIRKEPDGSSRNEDVTLTSFMGRRKVTLSVRKILRVEKELLPAGLL